MHDFDHQWPKGTGWLSRDQEGINGPTPHNRLDEVSRRGDPLEKGSRTHMGCIERVGTIGGKYATAFCT